MNIACTDFHVEVRDVPIPLDDGSGTTTAKLMVFTEPASGISFVFGPLNEAVQDAIHRGTSPLTLPPKVHLPGSNGAVRAEGEGSG